MQSRGSNNDVTAVILHLQWGGEGEGREGVKEGKGGRGQQILNGGRKFLTITKRSNNNATNKKRVKRMT